MEYGLKDDIANLKKILWCVLEIFWHDACVMQLVHLVLSSIDDSKVFCAHNWGKPLFAPLVRVSNPNMVKSVAGFSQGSITKKRQTIYFNSFNGHWNQKLQINA
jgi:hypothetical protein